MSKIKCNMCESTFMEDRIKVIGENEFCPVCDTEGCLMDIPFEVYDVRVGKDSTGSHLEYYLTKEDFEKGIGYPVDELEDEIREQVLLDIRNGKYAGKE